MAMIKRSRIHDYAQIKIVAELDLWTRTYWAKVDCADWPLVSAHTWHLTFDGRMAYPQSTMIIDGRKVNVSMGRHLLGEGELGNLGRIDHLNGNGMDCRRKNLRIATQSQLLAKRRPPAGGASQYKGVSWDAETNKWLAVFRGKKVGRYGDERDAARAFDDAALEYWGPNSGVYLNFPPRPRHIPMTGAKARLLVFAIEACLDTQNMQADEQAGAALRAARDAVEPWRYEPAGWVQPAMI